MNLSTAQVSAKTGIPVGTLRYWRAQGLPPKSFNLGRKVFYRAEDVDQWLAGQYESTVTGSAA
ncbi:DNA-binding protein [Corynebacterium jeikeium]|nr:DNA-binding protein [Corynebacterium jeikeium]